MEEKEYEKMYALEEEYWWWRGRRKIIQNFVPMSSSTPVRSPQVERAGEARVDTRCFVKKDRVVLDVGCGTGANRGYLEQYGKVVGIDNSEEALSFCKRRGSNPLVRATGEALPFSTASFESII